MSADKLVAVHPRLVVAVHRILAAMRELGFEMMVTDGGRTTVQQKKLYDQGRSSPGKIVTNADGLLKKSNHQIRDDGFGHAVDCCFIVDGLPSWDPKLPWALYGHMAETLGLTWGGNFKTFPDSPHVEIK